MGLASAEEKSSGRMVSLLALHERNTDANTIFQPFGCLLLLLCRESLRDYGMGMVPPPFGIMERRGGWMMHDMPPGAPMPPGARCVCAPEAGLGSSTFKRT